MKKFFVKKDEKSLEMVEIAALLVKNGYDVEAFVPSVDLAKVVSDGDVPVLVGGCVDENGNEVKFKGVVPKEAVVLTAKGSEKPLIKLVAKEIGVELTTEQKLVGFVASSAWDYAKLRHKGYSSKEIISVVDKQFFQSGGTRKELQVFRDDLGKHSGVWPLMELELESPKVLPLLKYYIGEMCFYAGKMPDVLVSFRDGTLPAFMWNKSLIKSLQKNFSGVLKSGIFQLTEAREKEFCSRVRNASK